MKRSSIITDFYIIKLASTDYYLVRAQKCNSHPSSNRIRATEEMRLQIDVDICIHNCSFYFQFPCLTSHVFWFYLSGRERSLRSSGQKFKLSMFDLTTNCHPRMQRHMTNIRVNSNDLRLLYRMCGWRANLTSNPTLSF